MDKNEIRQQYLKLIAKLYDLASQFDPDALHELREMAEDNKNRAVGRVISGLLMLLSEHEVPKGQRERDKELALIEPATSEVGLYSFFCSREVFKTSSDIISVLPFKFPMRAKEPRERFVRRLVGRINEMSAEDQRTLMADIQKSLSKRMGGNFVSSWSKLIRGL